MDPKISIDILRDLVSIFRQELTTFGYKKSDVDSIVGDDELIRVYYGVQRRLVSPVPRNLHSSKSLACPPEHASILASLERMIENGDNITPYLSTKIKTLNYNDLLLNDWGVHHLHLGANIKSDGFAERTGALLYCYFEEKNAYLINIFDHNDFTAQILIQTVHNNWPEILSGVQINGVKGDKLTDEQIRTLRNNNLNYALEMEDGKVYVPPGGGITCSGSNIHDIIISDKWIDWATHQQEKVIESMPNVIARAKQYERKFSKVIEFRLCRSGNAYWVDDIHSGYRHPLQSP